MSELKDRYSMGSSIKKTLELLEFPLLLNRLAEHTQFSISRDLALSLVPDYTHQEVLNRQRETTDAVCFLAQCQAPDMSMAKDVRNQIKRAVLGGILDGAELREIHDTLKVAREVAAALVSQKHLLILAGTAKQMPNIKDLESHIAASVGQEGEVLDKASLQLAKLRVQSRTAYNRLTDFLQKSMKALNKQGVLQEPLITERNGRMVLLAKVEMRNKIDGIVHDVSDSGATLFIEPLPAVSLGNNWRESRLEETREEQRILQDLSAEIHLRKDDILLILDWLARIDLVFAKARFGASVGGVPPAIVRTEKPYIYLHHARHPLLEEPITPNTVELGNEWSIMLITGPNAGGKTVAMKTIGLLTVMAQAGLYVPATEASMSVFESFYADIGDQQSIQRSLSTFSSHIYNLNNILKSASEWSLVLIDELGTSTDPEEGAALAKALLLEFNRRHIPMVATSHHREVAAFVRENTGMMNSSVELEAQSLAPSYKLTTGLPGRSYALTVASRLGIPKKVVKEAHSLLSDTHRSTESFLEDIQQERSRAVQNSIYTEKELNKARKLRQGLEERFANLNEEMENWLQKSRAKLQVRVEEMWHRLRKIDKTMKHSEMSDVVPDTEKQKQELVSLKKELKSRAWWPQKSSRQWLKDLTSGDFVRLRGVGEPVKVLDGSRGGDVLEVALGSMRISVGLEEVENKVENTEVPHESSIKWNLVSNGPVEQELDLRGQRVEKALEMLEGFLDKAILSVLPSVRIVHGVGTGSLRKSLREYLLKHPSVKSATPEESRNTDGATIVELGTDITY